MIGFLRGILSEKDAPNLLLEVNGIGYEIQSPLSIFTNLPDTGKEISLYIHLSKREDGDFLYGFLNKEQRALFRALIKVSSIGPKIALAILSSMDPNTFANHLSNDNTAALEHIPGIGAKTAKRLLVEMRDKIDEWSTATLSTDSPITNAMNDAIKALSALGYKPHETKLALRDIKDQNLSSEELIKLALKKIK